MIGYARGARSPYLLAVRTQSRGVRSSFITYQPRRSLLAVVLVFSGYFFSMGDLHHCIIGRAISALRIALSLKSPLRLLQPEIDTSFQAFSPLFSFCALRVTFVIHRFKFDQVPGARDEARTLGPTIDTLHPPPFTHSRF